MKHSYSRRPAEDTDMEELHGALLMGRTQTEVFRVSEHSLLGGPGSNLSAQLQLEQQWVY